MTQIDIIEIVADGRSIEYFIRYSKRLAFLADFFSQEDFLLSYLINIVGRAMRLR